jgi:hypothetical protein
MNNENAAAIGTLTLTSSLWTKETAIPTAADIESNALKLQDPRPGYKLYLPDRMISVPCGTDVNGHRIETSLSDFITLFPGVQAPVNCFGVYSIDWTIAE